MEAISLFIRIIVLISLGGISFSFFQAFRSFSLLFFLNKFISSKTEIGILLSLGSFIGIVIPPLIGYLSDKLRNFLKGRKVLIIFFLILFLFSIYGLEKVKDISSLYLYITFSFICFYSGFSIYQALIPDLIPRDTYARATGIINFTSQFFQGLYIFIVVIAHASNLTFKLLKYGTLISAFFLLFLPEKSGVSKKENLKLDLELFKGRFWFLLFFLQFSIWYGVSSVSSFILLFFQDALSASISDYMVVLAIFGILTALSTFVSGFLADKYSKEKLSVFSLFLFGLSSFLFSQTYRISHAFIASIIYGISLGSLMVIPYSLILEYTPKGKAGSFVGVNTLVISMSQVLAYFTSGMTIDLGGYRINFLQGLISSILGLLILKEIKNSRLKNLS